MGATKGAAQTNSYQRPVWAGGGAIAVSYYLQKDREIQTAIDTFYDASRFAGFGQYYGAYVEHRLNSTWSAVGSLGFRRLVMEGDAQLRGTTSVTKFRLTQDFLSIGLGLKHYLHQRLWLSGNFEVAKGTAVQLEVLQGASINVDKLDKPFFTVGTGGIGVDVPLGDFRLQPQLRLGIIPFADPFIVVMDAMAALDKSF